MKAIAISQRVAIDGNQSERRDCLDQRWAGFLFQCGLIAVPIPNSVIAANALCDKLPIDGVVLTGGNDLACLGGHAPERDSAEDALLNFAEKRELPLFGVCRGMQVIQHRYGIRLSRVEGHVSSRQIIRIDGAEAEVNSYHNFGTMENCDPFEVWAVADDGVIKAIRDPRRKMAGIMWHPERLRPFSQRDCDIFRDFFEVD
jgi:gamma-glutamyl-gamma-aminobutyrate hydrolase PuuD